MHVPGIFLKPGTRIVHLFALIAAQRLMATAHFDCCDDDNTMSPLTCLPQYAGPTYDDFVCWSSAFPLDEAALA